mmetsp:Transcript_14595/g.31439  ORF Transcript_14595/g.31439 Transcript_14595/m.31439 type:complete len:109 (-) Transcript_14595:878-1204(-)
MSSSIEEGGNAVLSNDAAPSASPSPRPVFTADRSRLYNVSSEIQCGEDHASGDDDLEEYGAYMFYMTLTMTRVVLAPRRRRGGGGGGGAYTKQQADISWPLYSYMTCM